MIIHQKSHCLLLYIVCHDIAHKYHSIILRLIHCWPFYKLLVLADLVPIVAVGCDCVYDRLMYLFTDLQVIYRLTGQSEKSNIWPFRNKDKYHSFLIGQSICIQLVLLQTIAIVSAFKGPPSVATYWKETNRHTWETETSNCSVSFAWEVTQKINWLLKQSAIHFRWLVDSALNLSSLPYELSFESKYLLQCYWELGFNSTVASCVAILGKLTLGHEACLYIGPCIYWISTNKAWPHHLTMCVCCVCRGTTLPWPLQSLTSLTSWSTLCPATTWSHLNGR